MLLARDVIVRAARWRRARCRCEDERRAMERERERDASERYSVMPMLRDGVRAMSAMRCITPRCDGERCLFDVAELR